MQLNRVIQSWARTAIILWSSMWVLAVPLFHIHPEADHRHGELGHVHGGTVHLAWSPDLDCESDDYPQANEREEPMHPSFSNPAQFSHPGDRHAEFSLSLLSDSTDRKSLKPLSTQMLGCSATTISDGQGSVRMQRSLHSILPSDLFPHTTSSRGPPHLLV